jgi:predicted cupin superfamily sugar epimerase
MLYRNVSRAKGVFQLRSFSYSKRIIFPHSTGSKAMSAGIFMQARALHVHVIHPNGKYELIRLGNNTAGGETFQAVVPAGCWFASETAEGGQFSFVGCTVSPGFDFADFELADGSVLSTEFPQFEKLITRLCR